MSIKMRNLISRKETFMFGLLSGSFLLLLLMAWVDFIDVDLEFFANLGTLAALFVTTYTYVASNVDMRRQRKIEAANRLRRPFMKLKAHNSVYIANVRGRLFSAGDVFREVPDYLMTILKVSHDHAVVLQQASDAALDGGFAHSEIIERMVSSLGSIRNELEFLEKCGAKSYKDVNQHIKSHFERFLVCAEEFRTQCKKIFPEHPSFNQSMDSLW